MAVKWTSSQSESGILRKSEFKEKKEELFVFGYSCKLFRDDVKALQIDQGKHLIPWMGDETLKIDRGCFEVFALGASHEALGLVASHYYGDFLQWYDARGALHDLASHEAPSGGFDWRVELTRTERDVELLCDEERYRALHTDEDEEEMYKEEELKRFHAAGYGQVGFNYDAPSDAAQPPKPVEVDEPFLPTPSFKALLPPDLVLPESDKQNVIIDKTAKFIASQGAQMEILIKAKQGDNPQFQFLNKDSPLHPYYAALIALVKAGKWPEKQQEVIEERPPENEEYLHPSLASTIIESAPSIPSIHYKPSADCDYTMLISKMRGAAPPDEPYAAELAPGELPPPGTEPLPPRPAPAPPAPPAPPRADIARPPVMYALTHDPSTPPPAPVPYTQAQYQQYLAYYQQYSQPPPATAAQPPPQPARTEQKPTSTKSTGLSLMKNYNTDSDSDVSDCDDTSSTDSKDKDKPAIAAPPEEVQAVIEKMADYVSRNGAEFADIVRAKGDPRLSFLEPSDPHHAYYCYRLAQIRGGEKQSNNKPTAPVSFSIKKLKEPDPILPKPALPYESSSDDDSDPNKQVEKSADKIQVKEDNRMNNIPILNVTNNAIPTVVYKMDGMQETNLPIVKAIEIKPKAIIPHVVAEPKLYKDEKPAPSIEEKPMPKAVVAKEPEVIKPSPEKTVKKRKPSPRVDKKEKIKKKPKTDFKEKERIRNLEREKKKEEKSKTQKSKDELENEIISLEDNSDDMIDLTGDQSDCKAEPDVRADSERHKQLERRRRAAEFLLKVGVDPAAAALPASSLASAMVDTLESIRKKKAEAEEKRRKREKRRHRDKYGYDGEDSKSHRKSKRRKHKSSDEGDSERESSKKKKRRKEKKSTKSKKRRRRSHSADAGGGEPADHPLPPSIDLSSTLKELRSSSPTKQLCLQEVVASPLPSKRDSSSSSDEEVNRRMRKNVKKDREYSEGEWSSDSEDDSGSEPTKNGE